MNQSLKAVGLESGIFDNQSLQWYRSCPQYYDWRANYQLIKPGAKKTAADFGSAIHFALEHYYKMGMTDVAIQESIEIFSEKFAPSQDPTDEKRSLLKGISILNDYFQRYRHEGFTPIKTEVGGMFSLNQSYLYSCRIDLILEWPTPKGIYGMDHKTTSSLGRLIAKPHNQLTGYEYLLRETFENVLGFILNCIGVYATDEEMDKNLPKVASPKTGKPIYQKVKREIFQRLPTTRTKNEIEEWKQQTIHLIHEIERSTEKKIWPRYTDYCNAFQSKCQFLDLCQAQSKEIYLPLLEAGIYEKSPWISYDMMGEEGDLQ